MFYKLLHHDESKGRIFIPPGFLYGRIFKDTDPFTISAGQRSESVKIERLKELKKYEMMVSRDVMGSLLVPDGLHYQMMLEGNCIRLGPCIGLLMAKSPRELTERRLSKLMPYTLTYPEIQGLLVATSIEGIDFENKWADGYCYNPGYGSKGTPWQPGRFPLPDSIFMRLNPPEPIRLKLMESTGNRMFNSDYFDKWQFWRMISKYPDVVEHLPTTRLYSSIDDVDHILSSCDSAYLKPLNGTLSRGLYKVLKTGEGYAFQDVRGREIKQITSKVEANSFLKRITAGHRYLVQQAVHSVKVEGRHVDFRVIMQKDHTMKWKCTGIVAFIGRPGDICSNWGQQKTFEDFFATHFNYSQEMIFKKRQEVIDICRNVCKILDSTGENFGDLGFDVIIDESLKVLVLESNKRHYHSVPLWINDTQTFLAVKSNPVKYAAALAGFNVY